MVENKNSIPTLCSVCGSKISKAEARCPVCGAALTADGKKENKRKQRQSKTTKQIHSKRMPEFQIGMPLLVLLLFVFIGLGVLGGYFGLNTLGRVAEPTVTATMTVTPTMTLPPTSAPPTVTFTPEPTLTPITHIVGEGESCSLIAARYQSSVQAIILENSLGFSCIVVEGQSVRVPQPTSTPTPLASPTPNATQKAISSCETELITVTAEDSLEAIAGRFSLSVQALREWNGLASDLLFEGQHLVIPKCSQAQLIVNSPMPTTTPTYAAPFLISPYQGQAYTITDDVVVLQWLSVGKLDMTEAYQVSVSDLTMDDEEHNISIMVFDTKFILPESITPNDNQPHVFIWWIQPVRQTGLDANGNPVWMVAGVRSEERLFSWVNDAPQATQTPPEAE